MPKSANAAAAARRAKPGARGAGGFFHIQVRPKSEFVSFRNQDVGARGGIERVAGRRANGSWDTQKWLIGKSEAHRAGKRLAPDTRGRAQGAGQLGSLPRHLGGDRFIAKPRRKIPAARKADAGHAPRASSPTSRRRRPRLRKRRRKRA